MHAMGLKLKKYKYFKYVMENPILAGGLIYYKFGKNLEKKLQKCNVVFL